MKAFVTPVVSGPRSVVADKFARLTEDRRGSSPAGLPFLWKMKVPHSLPSSL